MPEPPPGPPPDWATLGRAARDLAYNNNAAVADAQALIAQRDAASARLRAAGPPRPHAYGPHPRQSWDLYPGAPGAPCLVFIHGGYWQRNRHEDFACCIEGVRAHGWSAALPGYRLAPEARLGEIVAELATALDELATAGPAHGIGGPVILSGWSAGGHLTAMLLDHAAVAAGLAISGIHELGPLRDIYLNEALRLSDEEVATLSPLRRPAVHKPLAIAYGTRELPRLVADSRALHAHRAAQHAPGPLWPVPGADHFTILHELRAPASGLTRLLLDLAAAAVPG